MLGNKRNFSLSLWDHKDNFLCLLKSANTDFEGQSFQEDILENINGEKTLTLSVPMYIFDYDLESQNKFERNNICWDYIRNEQKIRYIEYDNYSNEPKKIQEFVLKQFTESRDGEQKIANCECESLAVYELGKVGWSINFDVDYITNYDFLTNEDLQTIDYWLRKIFYYETNLGKVSTTSECTTLMQGLQLRNSEGYPIDSQYTSDEDGNLLYNIIEEPECQSEEELEEYYNPSGWSWEVNALFTNNPAEESFTTNLYEEPVIGKYVEITPGNYIGFSYQKEIDQEDSEKRLLPHPIEKQEDGTYNNLMYVTDIKRRLITVERSNIFNAIQVISEAFEVWPLFTYTYNEQGKIIERKIIFITEAINDKIKFDFSYGKNIINCSRNTDSNDLVTKLIVVDTESQLVDGSILSIRQSTANPTGENYLYNFDYFYDIGNLTRLTPEEKNGNIEVDKHSDEFYFNQYAANLRRLNDEINNIQKSLLPLYTRQMDLQGELSVEEGSLNGYMDNIQSIESKINAIPPDSQIVKCWSEDNNQYNHVGEIKTFSTTTIGAEDYYYIKFGREDVIYNKESTFEIDYINSEGEEITESFSTSEYIPRLFNYGDWHTGADPLPDDDTQNFTLLIDQSSSATGLGNVEINNVIPDYSNLGDNTFIKGIYFQFTQSGTLSTYARVRYKYAPLAYYYLLIQDYWEKIKQVEEKVKELKENLQEINNKILVNELTLNGFLNNKKKLILQFERKYKPFIREGYWEPESYQSQLINNKLIASPNSGQGYEGLVITSSKLSELNLNDSLHNYSYYIDLNRNAAQVDIDSIKMTTSIRLPGTSIITEVPRYRGKDYEIFTNNTNNLIIGIAPELIDYYVLNRIENYNCKLEYYISGNELIVENKDWINFNQENSPVVIEKSIYITNDNILTDSIMVYGITDGETDPNPENILETYVDYTYIFDYIAYDEQGNRVDISQQESYSSDLHYDYITRIDLKSTNRVNSFTSSSYIVTYNVETTLQYLYNDAVSTSKKYAVPQVTYSLSVLDLSSLNDYKNYKPVIGQKVPIYDVEMGFNGYNGFITSVQKELESPENTEITIATFETKFEDIFQQLTATMTDIQYNANSIYKAADSFNTNGSIKTEVFQKSLEDNALRINLGVNNDISINEVNGITLTDRDSNNAVKLIGNGVFLTRDITSSPVQWQTGITGEGINASAITSGNIDTKQISIWNASEGQVRFTWNEEGLFAYGDKFGDDSSEDLIDYDKYVKFNQNGLDFSDNGKSALKLGWDGLKINTQNNSLVLDADKGLILREWNNNIATTRLELGKLGGVYGLKLYNKQGNPTFQSDSDGDLWLSEHIKVGGSFNGTQYTIAPTAGIVGLEQPNNPYQMGVMRNTSTGDVIWNGNALRFWAGPQTKQQYLENLSMSLSDLSGTALTNFNSLSDNDPALSRFKVDSQGNIVASGIDVGGWIGAGKILRSKNYEAILRSDGYSVTVPVFAIGKNGNSYNFQVFQDGSIDIGNGEFHVTAGGAITANNISIDSSDSTITGGSIGGWSIASNGIYKVSGDYTTGIYPIANSTDYAIRVGLTESPSFIVNGKGEVTATDITITGSGKRAWIIDSEEFQVDGDGQIGASIIPENRPSTFNYNNYNFSVSRDGNIRFRGTISAYYDNNWYTGVDQEIVTTTVGGVTRSYRVVKGLIVGRTIS